MTTSERKWLLNELDRTRERVMHTTERLSPEQLEYREKSERWSTAEILEHLILAERLMLRLMQRCLQEAPDCPMQSAWQGRDEALRARMARRENRLETPAAFKPVRSWPTAQLLHEFEAARRQTLEFAAAADGELRRYLFPHPALGLLDCYQWLLLIGVHCDRHCAQIDDIMALDGFPVYAAGT